MLCNATGRFVCRALTAATCLILVSLVGIASAQQQASAKRVGVLFVGMTPQELIAFKQGFRDAGYTEGRDLVFDWRLAQGDSSRVSTLLADLLRARPDVIVVDTTAAARAAKQAQPPSQL